MIHYPRAIVFKSAGILGYAYLGVLDALEDYSILDGLEYFAGCSSGSIFAWLLALELTADDIRCAILNEDLSDVLSTGSGNGFCCSGLINLFTRLGVYRVDGIKDVLTRIAERAYKSTLTFEELYERNGHTLVITTNNQSTNQMIYFSRYTTPNISCVDAVMASISIPVLFEPYIIDGQMYTDCGFYEPFTPWVFNNLHELDRGIFKPNRFEPIPDTTIGVYVYTPDDISNQIPRTVSLFKYTIDLFNDCITPKYVEEYDKYRTIIKIPIPSVTKNAWYDFQTSETDLKSYIQKGYYATCLHYKQNTNNLLLVPDINYSTAT